MKTENETKHTHTRTPWEIDTGLYGRNNEITIWGEADPVHDGAHQFIGTLDVAPNSQANAAFIVEACNNYEQVKSQRDELAEALRQAQKSICLYHCRLLNDDKHIKACNAIKAALAKLEGSKP